MESRRTQLTIREARPQDWDAIWPFLHEIVAAGETYAYDRDTTEADGRGMWMVGPPWRTVVATDADGTVLGTANMPSSRPTSARWRSGDHSDSRC